VPVKFTLRSPRIPSRRPVFRPTDASTGAAQTNANPLSLGLSSGAFIEKSCALEIGGPSRRDGEPQARCHRGEATFLIPADVFPNPASFSALNDRVNTPGRGGKNTRVATKSGSFVYFCFPPPRPKDRASVGLSNYNRAARLRP